MHLITILKPFNQLSPDELYAIMRLRNEVFVVEQNCVYQDADLKDSKCHHLMIFGDDELLAYARLVPPGLSFTEMSIGRVVTSSKGRGSGNGRLLVALAIEKCREIFGPGPIKIGAQAYLRKFYGSFGFQETGEIYDEDGIPHIDMILN
ncbi:ElaA protein [Mucilaginibacter mallensis]|uniref:ElaA protein n=1 Tax=Mucilaginibacter mallensis TaxID=652787 RepID=A0A1H1T3V8_MUCMA|nr:GNAT family N-acetyltransferase [Mucilaginibacter mallensis]SDS54927.1 ElaA protein [Mucilaginibacter mallensis]